MVPFPPHPHQHLLLFVFLMTDILTEIRWNINVVLIYISLMGKDMHLVGICNSLENYLLKPFAHLLIELFEY
jgi:hypothetical protein